MHTDSTSLRARLLGAAIAVAWTLAATPAFAFTLQADCDDQGLPDDVAVQNALVTVLGEQNGGLGFDMWATIVNRDGEVCLVVHSGATSDDQWPGSRVISAQKANTANAFSLDGLALSTANLFTAVQPGGSLFGLQESNPVDTAVAYGDDAAKHGDDTGPATPSTDYGAGSDDPMVGHIIGGVNVFGGGLALYDQNQHVIGGLGISGDTSCTDHIVAWKLRDALGLDNVPGGVSPTGDDNIIHDITNPSAEHRHAVSASGFGHPTCINLPGTGDAKQIAENLPTTDPIGPNP